MVYRTATIFNDLEGPQTQISRSGHSLTLNISEMAKDSVPAGGDFVEISLNQRIT